MSSVNREISYSLNSLGPWYDELIANLGGTVSRVPYYAGVPTIAQAAQTPPGEFPNVNYIINGLAPDNPPVADNAAGIPIPPANTPGVENTSGIFSFESFFGTDAATVGKYVLLATLALIIIGVGIFAIIEPGAKFVAKEGAKAAA